jgi:hypothetical protein
VSSSQTLFLVDAESQYQIQSSIYIELGMYVLSIIFAWNRSPDLERRRRRRRRAVGGGDCAGREHGRWRRRRQAAAMGMGGGGVERGGCGASSAAAAQTWRREHDGSVLGGSARLASAAAARAAASVRVASAMARACDCERGGERGGGECACHTELMMAACSAAARGWRVRRRRVRRRA